MIDQISQKYFPRPVVLKHVIPVFQRARIALLMPLLAPDALSVRLLRDPEKSSLIGLQKLGAHAAPYSSSFRILLG
uniref:SAM-dependent methyltransferase n=1 Tax=Steinernema glaseri TaxID=37863 RepID=A0A1I7Z4D7_9BILA